MSRRVHPVVLTALLFGLAACGGRDGDSASPTSPSGSSCPSPSAAADSWPTEVPASMPTPAGLSITSTQRVGDGVIVEFSTALSLYDAGRFVLDDLRPAGITPRGGDAERSEIDQPFFGDGFVGSLRLEGVAACRTDGTLRVAPPSSAPGPEPSPPTSS